MPDDRYHGPPQYGISNSYKPPPAAEAFGYLAEHLQDPRVGMAFPGVGLGFRVPGGLKNLTTKSSALLRSGEELALDPQSLSSLAADYLGSNVVGRGQMMEQINHLDPQTRNLILNAFKGELELREVKNRAMAWRGMDRELGPGQTERLANDMLDPKHKSDAYARYDSLDSVRDAMGWTHEQFMQFTDYLKANGQLPAHLRPWDKK